MTQIDAILGGVVDTPWGKYPVFWAIRNREKYSGITVHYLSEAIDGGDIILQKAVG
ncbi:MAG: formyltransferase family protein [bacterium]